MVDEILAPDVDAATAWRILSTRSRDGEAYLEERGLWPEVLRAADVVRFNGDGDVCVALHHLAIGAAVVNVVRRLHPRNVRGKLKVLGLRDCSNEGTLVGHVDQIRSGDRVVLVEGVVDSLTARCAWPGAVVLGAHGAAKMPEVAAEAARRCYQLGASLTIVADDDPTGTQAGVAAAKEAIAAGLVPHETLFDVDLEGRKDLADAWKDGWRPS